MPERMLCVADSETTGLIAGVHEITEISWLVLETGEHGTFIPPHTLDNATSEALNVSRYYDRHLWVQTSWDEDGTELGRFHTALAGNWFVGSKPTFDAAFLSLLFIRDGLDPEPWWRFPLDLGTYAAGVMSRPITDRVGLTQLCNLLGVLPGHHSAQEDVRATAECLIELQHRANYRRAA